MGEGWETRRRREPGNEWLVVRLTGQSEVALAEIDTSGYIGNPPGAASLLGIDATVSSLGRFVRGSRCSPAPRCYRTRRTGSGCPAHGRSTHVRLDVFPDGGVARLRLHGSLTSHGLAGVRLRWAETAGS